MATAVGITDVTYTTYVVSVTSGVSIVSPRGNTTSAATITGVIPSADIF